MTEHRVEILMGLLDVRLVSVDVRTSGPQFVVVAGELFIQMRNTLGVEPGVPFQSINAICYVLEGVKPLLRLLRANWSGPR